MKSRIRGLNPLLVILAVALVSVLFALACGQAEEATEAPEPTATTAPTTPSEDDAMEDDVMEDDVMEDDVMEDDVMEDDVMEDDVMEDDAMDEGDAMMDEGPVYGGTLRVAQPPDHSPPDPIDAEAGIILNMIEQVFEPLIRLNPDATYRPVLAESWQVNDDATQYTFNLRQGVTFHNGADFTAEDVVFTLGRARNPDISVLASKLETVTGVIPVDDYTVRIELSAPNVLLLDTLFLNQASILDSDTDIEKLRSGEEVYGTGPFMLEELLPRERITMVRNPSHWSGNLPYLDEVVYIGIQEQVGRRVALLNGDVDVITELAPSQVASINANPTSHVVSVESSGWTGIAINNQIPPFDNKLVRQALRYAIDRELVNQVAFQGLGAPMNDSPVFPGDARFFAAEYVPEYDPERAAALLAEAGFPDGIDIEIETTDLGNGMLELPIAFKDSAAAAGINVTINVHPSDGFWGSVYPNGPLTVFWNSPRAEPNHSLTITYHSAETWAVTYFDKILKEGYDFAPYGIADWVTFESVFTDTPGPLAQELDALIERARGESVEDRAATYNEVQAFLAEEVPALAIISWTNLAGIGNDVQGLVLSGVSGNIYYDTVWLQP